MVRDTHEPGAKPQGVQEMGYHHSTVTNAALTRMSSTTSRFLCLSLAKHFNSDRRQCHNGIEVGFIRKRQHWKVLLHK